MKCYCFLRNVNDIQFFGTTPYYKRFGKHFKGHCIPFGAEVGYLQFDRDGKATRDHPMHSKIHKGLFLGYDVKPGGHWSGDYFVINAEQLDNADSVHSVRSLKVKTIIAPEYFIFPVATGAVKQPENRLKGRVELDDNKSDKHLSELFDWPNLYSDDEPDNTSEKHEVPDGPLEELPEADAIDDLFFSDDEGQPSGGSIPSRDCWSFDGISVVRHHVEPRLDLYSPDDTCPMPLKSVDVHGVTKTNLGDISEHSITDWWGNVSSPGRTLSKPWTGTTTFQLVQPTAKQHGHAYLSGRDLPVRMQADSHRPEDFFQSCGPR